MAKSTLFHFTRRVVMAAALSVISFSATADDKVTFATNWKAQASQGGFFQAVADGTYKKYGLDVEIQQGGPQVNNRPMLAAGRVDFLLTGGLLTALENTRAKIPTAIVAAFFQRDPTALITHKGAYKNFDELTQAKQVMIAKGNQFGFWQWLKAEHGFSDEQFRPYNFNMAPFFADTTAVQQAFATAEPIYAAEQGMETDTYMLADYGYNTYGNLVETRLDLIEKNPELVQRFVDASIVGWYNFLYGDPTPGLDLIKKLNPDLDDAKLAAERELVIQQQLVDSGQALEAGIGALDLDRIQDFGQRMIKAGIYAEGEVDPSKVGTDQFVNKKVGMDIKSSTKDK